MGQPSKPKHNWALISGGGALHVERLVWAFGIELANEGIEAVLLLQAVEARS
jgi:hypothetical protein